MSSPAHSPAAVRVAARTAEFDDIGALVAAMRHMLGGDDRPSKVEARHLYVLACQAEAAWLRLEEWATARDNASATN